MSLLEQHLHPPERDPENPLASDWLVFFLRWLWLGSVFVIALFSPIGAQSRFYVFVVVGVGAILNLAQAGALYVQWYPDWMRIAGVAADTLVSILLLALTGGWESP
jgi:hypothetical protein